MLASKFYPLDDVLAYCGGFRFLDVGGLTWFFRRLRNVLEWIRLLRWLLLRWWLLLLRWIWLALLRWRRLRRILRGVLRGGRILRRRCLLANT